MVHRLALFFGIFALAMFGVFELKLPQAISNRLVRPALGVLAVALAVKTGAEAGGLSLGWSDLPGDVVVAWQAHLLGAVAGAAAVVACGRCVRKAM